MIINNKVYYGLSHDPATREADRDASTAHRQSSRDEVDRLHGTIHITKTRTALRKSPWQSLNPPPFYLMSKEYRSLSATAWNTEQGIRTVFKSDTTLRSHLVRPKDTVDPAKQDGVVQDSLRVRQSLHRGNGEIYAGEDQRTRQGYTTRPCPDLRCF